MGSWWTKRDGQGARYSKIWQKIGINCIAGFSVVFFGYDQCMMGGVNGAVESSWLKWLFPTERGRNSLYRSWVSSPVSLHVLEDEILSWPHPLVQRQLVSLPLRRTIVFILTPLSTSQSCRSERGRYEQGLNSRSWLLYRVRILILRSGISCSLIVVFRWATVNALFRITWRSSIVLLLILIKYSANRHRRGNLSRKRCMASDVLSVRHRIKLWLRDVSIAPVMMRSRSNGEMWKKGNSWRKVNVWS